MTRTSDLFHRTASYKVIIMIYKVNCEKNSDFITHNCEFISHSSDLFLRTVTMSRNYNFLTRNSQIQNEKTNQRYKPKMKKTKKINTQTFECLRKKK